MKRLIFFAVIFFAAAFHASAQYQEYYILEQVGQENPSLYSIKIDWKNNFFFIEGDGAIHRHSRQRQRSLSNLVKEETEFSR